MAGPISHFFLFTEGSFDLSVFADDVPAPKGRNKLPAELTNAAAGKLYLGTV